MPGMDESYILLWMNEAGGIRTLLIHDDVEGDEPDPEYTEVRAYRRDQLRADTPIADDAIQVKSLVVRSCAQEPVAIPVSLAREMGWFPNMEYRGFVTEG